MASMRCSAADVGLQATRSYAVTIQDPEIVASVGFKLRAVVLSCPGNTGKEAAAVAPRGCSQGATRRVCARQITPQ